MLHDREMRLGGDQRDVLEEFQLPGCLDNPQVCDGGPQ
jgi:hypothetical protein